MTKLFHHDRPVTGIDISPTGLRALTVNTKTQTLDGYGSIDLDPLKLQESLNGNGDYLSENLKTLLGAQFQGRMHSNQVAIGIPTARTYNRIMEIPVSSADKLDEAVGLEAEQYIPTPVSELSIDYEIVEQTKEQLTILMSAVPKKIVESIIAACHAAGLEVMLVEPGISAIGRLISKTEKEHFPTVLVDIGAASTDIAVLDKTIRLTGAVQVGGNSFTIAISKKMKVSLEKAHQLKVLKGLTVGSSQKELSVALTPSIKQITDEVQKMIRYYTERLGSPRKIEQVIIVGSGSNVPGIGDFFTNQLQMPARLGNPWQVFKFGNLPQPSRQYRAKYVTAAGLAYVEPQEIWQ